MALRCQYFLLHLRVSFLAFLTVSFLFFIKSFLPRFFQYFLPDFYKEFPSSFFSVFLSLFFWEFPSNFLKKVSFLFFQCFLPLFFRVSLSYKWKVFFQLYKMKEIIKIFNTVDEFERKYNKIEFCYSVIVDSEKCPAGDYVIWLSFAFSFRIQEKFSLAEKLAS